MSGMKSIILKTDGLMSSRNDSVERESRRMFDVEKSEWTRKPAGYKITDLEGGALWEFI